MTENISKILKKDKNQHIQVFVRVRPINNSEKASRSLTLVDVPSSKEVIVRERPQDKISKKFTFDKVFGPASKQVEVYDAVVRPLLDEVLAGYNCTVFAYGQTGTGKTFTMEGVSTDLSFNWQSDTTAGIIPRSLSHLFDELRTLGAQEYSVRVSFLELYNEELFDLLSPSDDASRIRIYEDTTKKGAVIIHGLEEVTVHNKSEVYKILAKGSEKRQTAATLMNAHSSRSHTVFSITVHIKENTLDGEELLKTGKLNLVDLAGSENVGRSGAVERRAREAGNINQSLLTLGRVITALVERAPHIPYRESKLTRLLQESLGGRTKTSIIATISPASINLEETLSTLDYAHRAKNITNRPEINQKLSKKALLKEYTEEIERLRRELTAARERNGVYLLQEDYDSLQVLLEQQGKEIEEKINHMKALEELMRDKEKLFNDLESSYERQKKVLEATEQNLHSTKNVLQSTKHRLMETEQDRDENKYLVQKHVTTEKVLYDQAQTLLNVADTATHHTVKLHEKIGRKTHVEEENEALGKQFKADIAKRFANLENDFSVYTQELVQLCLSTKSKIEDQMNVQSNSINKAISQISKSLLKDEISVSRELSGDIEKSFNYFQTWSDHQLSDTVSTADTESQLLEQLSTKLASKIYSLVQTEITNNLQKLEEEVREKLKNLSCHVKTSVDSICNSYINDRDAMCKNIQDMNGELTSMSDNQKKIFEEQHNFNTAFENLFHQYKKLNAEENRTHSMLCQSIGNITQVCDSVKERTMKNCDLMVQNENNLEEKVRCDTLNIAENVSSAVKENSELIAIAVDESQNVVHEMESEINNTRCSLREHKNSMSEKAKTLKEKLEEDKSGILASVESLHKVVVDAGVNHQELMEQQRGKLERITAEVTGTLEKQSVDSSEWQTKITTQLHTTQHQIDKFLEEDLRHDVPTGTTPVRMEYKYPRKLAATSPHERIIQRFREARREVESLSENEEDTLSADCNTSPIANSTMHIAPSSPPKLSASQNNLKESEDGQLSIIKAASTSDLSITSRPSSDYATHSESELYLNKNNNKENSTTSFLKPDATKTKRLSKVKNGRRILGSYN